jgi:flavin-dependent dehydrogenase
MIAENTYQYDIAIVGGGLAGLTLAIQCADAGYKTVLFEKEAYPFHKVCGEFISNESRNFLQQCGIQLDEWGLPSITSLEVSDMQGRMYGFELPMGGFGVSRHKLDNALFQVALQKGVTVHQSCKVNDVLFEDNSFTIHVNNTVYRSKLAAGCFGKRSNLDLKWERSFVGDKRTKLNNLIAVKYHIRYPQKQNTISLHNFDNGYCGISAIEDGSCCLCYLTTAENLNRSNNSIKTMENNILARNPQLETIFANAAFLYKEPLAISQVSFLPKKQVENHVLMLGDAAGLITPLCGNGMSMAMHAAKLAFIRVDLFLNGQINREQMELAYTDDWQQNFASRLHTGRLVQRFFGGSISTALFLRLMHAFPAISRQVIRKTHGQPF